MAAAHRILIVDDDEIIRAILAAHLTGEGHAVTAAASVAEALAAYRRGRFDLALVDVNLPDGLGFDLVPALHAWRDCAILYLTSRGGSGDRVRGLSGGGDDYLVKPVDLAELSARIDAVSRRHRGAEAPSARLLSLADWTLDLVRRELADPAGEVVAMTRGEFDLLSALVQASPTALDRDYLLEVVSSVQTAGNARTIDVMVSRVRAKLQDREPSPLRIVTVRGGGYRFECAAP